ncbi:hypothetical protein BS47DRAFT_1350045 [Hydnum rufescens UP504]|uniref:HNH nuclease domain-containing protein n=1 Tax=Hydnum rufescens UP504 TaxID=1448309 RepID=A0A9P6AN14_9AGAM|nr:hypothetical protein BS47DRAFT_1350045 [Hydnum rufescens UP504]
MICGSRGFTQVQYSTGILRRIAGSYLVCRLALILDATVGQEPMAQPPEVELWFSFNNLTRHALSIPITECQKYAVNPLKWLRFLGYAICGQQGQLSISNTGPPIDDYLAAIEARPYYFVSQDDPCFVDFDAMEDRTSDASVVTDRRGDFEYRVRERDVTCVVTGDSPRFCDACHILPHSKGDNYIVNVINYRGGLDHPEDIQAIDDPRNGFLLNLMLHRLLGDGDSAFLKTPNFALTVDDIPSTPPRQAGMATPASRSTLHHFLDVSTLSAQIHHFSPNNTDARHPQNMDQWPPALILDYVHGVAILKAWGRQDFVNYTQAQTKAAYYDDIEGEDEDEDDNNQITGPHPAYADVPVASTSAQAPQHNYFLRSRGPMQPPGQQKQRRIDDIRDAILGLWMHSTKRVVRKPKTDASGSARNEDISMWLQSVVEASDPYYP